MKYKRFSSFVVILLAFFFACDLFAQVATKTGSIYGKVVDSQNSPLPGVSITLESETIPPQTATSGAAGAFRFANLPPGLYSVTFVLEGFTEVRQEDVRVSTGSQVQLEIKLKPSLSEEFTIVAETPVVDTKKTGSYDTYNRDYLEDIPSGRDPWVIIDQTAGIDTDRYNVAGSESGQQSSFLARGGNDDNTVWNYDGLDITDPQALGASPSYFDFDSFEELQITTGGNDASIPTGGVAVNIVSKRAGNKWNGNASFFFVNDSLQANNTPDELRAAGQDKSNRLDEVKDYGFDLGGPLLKDKLFAWGAFRKVEVGLFTATNLSDFTELTIFNLKTNMNWTPAHESQFGYNTDNKEKQGRGFQAGIQAKETLWNQGGSSTILEGIWTGQHTWIPNDHTILTGRYGYNGNGFTLIPEGGNDKPMILLGAIPRFEQTAYYLAPIDRPSHDVTAEVNYFKEHWGGGDHEFRFGFEYKNSNLHTFSSYGNGQLLVDFYQTTPGGALTSGYLYAQHFIDGHININRASAYITDTLRKDRLTLNLGLRLDRQDGKNNPSDIPGTPGFENIVGPLNFAGNDPGVNFTDFSPRLGATYDLTGDGKTVIRGNFAHYYDTYNPAFLTHQNPTFVYNGAVLDFVNSNGDREITSDEIVSGPRYYGGLNGPIFNIDAFLAKRLVDPDLKNSHSYEYMAGFERELMDDVSVSVTFTHRDYRDNTAIIPFGISSADFVPAGTFVADTSLGHFEVPIYTLGIPHDGRSILTNIKDYKPSYNGLDLALRKRMSNNFLLNGSLTLQRQKAHYDGGDSAAFSIGDGGISGLTFPFDPGQVPFLDDRPYAFAPGGSGKSGVYPYSEWQLKFSGVYQFPWSVSVGAFGRYQQGYPYVLFGKFRDTTLSEALGTSSHLILLEPFGDRRYDNIFTLDMQFEKAFELSQYGKVSLLVDLFNLTNSNTVIRRTREVTSTQFNAIEENLSPRAIRFGVRYSF